MWGLQHTTRVKKGGVYTLAGPRWARKRGGAIVAATICQDDPPARFAGERATDAENNAALLAALDELTADAAGTRTSDFKARFRCVLALVDPFVRDGEPFVVEGTCSGKITRTPRGSGGFGYDPLFLVEGTDKTMAELTEDEKNRISHRGRATQQLRLALEKTLAARDELTRTVVG
ncbi:MAG: non-canonical purine NTP pyrophosphatase [Myxococcales bacterium]|nr:non-canonical purine NTP pyrophosphatase [Myxococcales bacterium]